MITPSLNRRQMLAASGLGIGSLALEQLLGPTSLEARETVSLKPRAPHFAPRITAVIMMMQNGGPSQMELFDPKPALNKYDGKVHPEPLERFQTGSEDNKILGTPFRFDPCGSNGTMFSEAIPHLRQQADDFCLVRSMVSEHNNHTEALVLLNTGKIFPGRPALGSWISYALGTENQNLPSYIVLRDPEGYNTSGTLLWQNGWLPALYRGTEFSTKGTPLLNLQPESPTSGEVQQTNLRLLGRLNRDYQSRFPDDTDLETRIQNYELSARMQLAAPQLLDMSRETEATRSMYGLDNSETAGYGMRCLMARRFVEAGVRFIQIFPPAKPNTQPWDSHGNVKTELPKICGKTDLPSAALLRDLKQRGLLESTLVIWSGEFGRLPISQNGSGRDHNRNAFSLILAGGGFRGGQAFGATDELGYRSVENVVTVPDLHATILHQMGLDHQRLTFRHHGSDETLTDSRVTNARVVREILESPA